MRRPLFRRQSSAVLVGAGLFLAGSFCLYDAWERRGQDTPRLLRPVLWF